jgi:hypothetical protein
MPPLLTLQECHAKEGKCKDRWHSAGLLKEIHSLKKSTHKLIDAIDTAPHPTLWGQGSGCSFVIELSLPFTNGDNLHFFVVAKNNVYANIIVR